VYIAQRRTSGWKHVLWWHQISTGDYCFSTTTDDYSFFFFDLNDYSLIAHGEATGPVQVYAAVQDSFRAEILFLSELASSRRQIRQAALRCKNRRYARGGRGHGNGRVTTDETIRRNGRLQPTLASLMSRDGTRECARSTERNPMLWCDVLVAGPSFWSLDICALHTYDDGAWHDASGGAGLARVAIDSCNRLKWPIILSGNMTNMRWPILDGRKIILFIFGYIYFRFLKLIWWTILRIAEVISFQLDEFLNRSHLFFKISIVEQLVVQEGKTYLTSIKGFNCKT
jgi:hypothetical protein